MEIQSFSNIPQDPNRRAAQKPRVTEEVSRPASDQFVGPNVEAKLQKLREIDASREALIADLKKDVEEGNYLTEERLQATVSKLLSSL